MNSASRDYEQKELEYENQVASRYNRDYHEAPIMQWHNDAFIEFVKRHYTPGDRVLDLGCGPASLWTLLKANLPNPGALVGVDLSPGMIEEANRVHPDGDFRVGSMFSVPSDAGEFDLVIVSSAFHHVLDSDLPLSLREISRIMSDRGLLVGREPLMAGRIGDRGGWFAGALMSLRHLAYRLTNTREYPEPDAGPAHHAYVATEFFDIIEAIFSVTDIEFRNPVSHFLSRVRDPYVAQIAKMLDESVDHKEGQEFHYATAKNRVAPDVNIGYVRHAIEENKIENVSEFLALVDASASKIEASLGPRRE
jgi:ubiquinone/menaquinone biosynthesis C-methylase UbiE